MSPSPRFYASGFALSVPAGAVSCDGLSSALLPDLFCSPAKASSDASLRLCHETLSQMPMASSSQETETGRSCDIWIWTWILTLQSSGYPDLPRIMIKVASKIATEVALILVIRKLKNL